MDFKNGCKGVMDKYFGFLGEWSVMKSTGKKISLNFRLV